MPRQQQQTSTMNGSRKKSERTKSRQYYYGNKIRRQDGASGCSSCGSTDSAERFSSISLFNICTICLKNYQWYGPNGSAFDKLLGSFSRACILSFHNSSLFLVTYRSSRSIFGSSIRWGENCFALSNLSDCVWSLKHRLKNAQAKFPVFFIRRSSASSNSPSSIII